MASLNRDGDGFTVQVVGSDGKRRSIRLGKVPRKVAENIQLKIEHLAALIKNGLAPDPETVAWVESVGDELAAKLAAVGLMTARTEKVELTLGQFLDDYIADRKVK